MGALAVMRNEATANKYARDDAEPGNGAHQGPASVPPGVATMRYVQMSPSRGVPVVKATKQFRWKTRGKPSPSSMTSTMLVPGVCEMFFKHRKHASGFIWLIGVERYG